MVEERFQAGEGETGLDQHRVRRWRSWHRYTTLVVLAHAILTAIAVAAHATHYPAEDLIPLTVNEIRHLFAKLVLTPARTVTYWLTWSDWRRRHQARAKLSHHRRRQAIDMFAFDVVHDDPDALWVVQCAGSGGAQTWPSGGSAGPWTTPASSITSMSVTPPWTRTTIDGNAMSLGSPRTSTEYVTISI